MTNAVYTSRIIKATALITDTKTLLVSWDLTRDVSSNLDYARRTNIFGKASRARIEDILAIFRQRYFDDPEVGQALVTLVQGNVPGQWVDPLLYYYSVQNDSTLRDVILEVVAKRGLNGYTDISVEHVMRALREWVAEGKTTTAWGEKTMLRVAQHAVATLRDFGILQGKVNKSITPLYLPLHTFGFVNGLPE